MGKTKIMNTYAIKQGYKNWSAILFQFQDDFNYASPEDENNIMNWIEYHINTVTDLIQEELKKKCAENKHPFTQEILNTEIL